MPDNHSNTVRKKIKKYCKEDVKFTKKDLLDWLAQRNHCSLDDMKEEVLSLKHMVHAELQTREHQGEGEERFVCYLVYSNTKGRRYVLRFNKHLKIITAHPLGRSTLTRYRKRFK